MDPILLVLLKLILAKFDNSKGTPQKKWDLCPCAPPQIRQPCPHRMRPVIFTLRKNSCKQGVFTKLIIFEVLSVYSYESILLVYKLNK